MVVYLGANCLVRAGSVFGVALVVRRVSIRSESGLYAPSARVLDVKGVGHQSHSNLFLCLLAGAVGVRKC